MRVVAPQVKTAQQPVQFLDSQRDGLVGEVGRGFETFRLHALEAKTKTVALPVKDFHSVPVTIQKNEKHRVQYRYCDIHLDQDGQAIDGFSEVDRFGVEVHFLYLHIGSYHGKLASEKSTGAQHRGSTRDFQCADDGLVTSFLEWHVAQSLGCTRQIRCQAICSLSCTGDVSVCTHYWEVGIERQASALRLAMSANSTRVPILSLFITRIL